MFGLGFWEVMVVLILGLVVLGPHRLPRAARQLGRGLRELRRAANELQSSLEDADLPSPRDLGNLRQVKSAIESPVRSIAREVRKTAEEALDGTIVADETDVTGKEEKKEEKEEKEQQEKAVEAPSDP